MEFIRICLCWIVIIGFFSSIENVYGCDLSDNQAINLSKIFCENLNLSCPQEPWVLRTDKDWQASYLEYKDVRFGIRGSYKITMHANCNNKEIDFYNNSALKQQVREKYKISPVTTEEHNWPTFLSEAKAKEKIFAIAKKIGFSKDVEFSQLGLDKENGYWGGNWIRKYNGFQYEKDFINIAIMAVDGEFVLYGKKFMGKPCPTDIKITKVEAIEEGWQQVERLFKDVDWAKQKPDYEIKSAELKIVQPNTLLGQIVKQHSTESRLAWVIIYGLKTKPDQYKLAEVSYLQRITIKIDAATKKLLGGDFTQ